MAHTYSPARRESYRDREQARRDRTAQRKRARRAKVSMLTGSLSIVQAR